MQIEILRLNHRIGRDPRISSHVALTSRALGACKVYYSGDKDKSLEDSIYKITKKFGGPFEIEYCENDLNLVKKKKKDGFLIIHLTMYGKDFKSYKKKILKNSKVLVIVGGEKVEGAFYNIQIYR